MPPLLLGIVYLVIWLALAFGGTCLVRDTATRWSGGVSLAVWVLLGILGWLVVVPLFGHA